MYGLNEFDIQILYGSEVFDRILFKLIMNQILTVIAMNNGKMKSFNAIV